ncbi:hypothetical protein Glove_233g25 [Diversispora epigaea]|uniref:Uncharacterized protein n=1 Tax=Diversispora epigaea TaxID=1348612 RepID=A0A397IB02_9GLOM|nr:hypothetical protein Glove_233g25 [Diversispora epigaea]
MEEDNELKGFGEMKETRKTQMKEKGETEELEESKESEEWAYYYIKRYKLRGAREEDQVTRRVGWSGDRSCWERTLGKVLEGWLMFGGLLDTGGVSKDIGGRVTGRHSLRILIILCSGCSGFSVRSDCSGCSCWEFKTFTFGRGLEFKALVRVLVNLLLVVLGDAPLATQFRCLGFNQVVVLDLEDISLIYNNNYNNQTNNNQTINAPWLNPRQRNCVARGASPRTTRRRLTNTLTTALNSNPLPNMNVLNSQQEQPEQSEQTEKPEQPEHKIINIL